MKFICWFKREDTCSVSFLPTRVEPATPVSPSTSAKMVSAFLSCRVGSQWRQGCLRKTPPWECHCREGPLPLAEHCWQLLAFYVSFRQPSTLKTDEKKKKKRPSWGAHDPADHGSLLRILSVLSCHVKSHPSNTVRAGAAEQLFTPF